MESYFHELAAILDGLVASDEAYTAWFAGEASDFVRLNRSKVRQPGTVVQRTLTIDWMRGTRHAKHSVSLSGHPVADRVAIEAAVGILRTALPDLDPDPHLLISTDVRSSRSIRREPLPPAEEIVAAVLAASVGLDLVGFYAGGPVYRGFTNSLGQRNWHEATSFNLQWSLYHTADKAVKSAQAGLTWDRGLFEAKMDAARAELAHLARPAKSLPPGSYRAFLSPAAMEEIAGLLCWGGFSARGLATRQSPLSRMREDEGGTRLDPRICLTEAVADGVAPGFQAEGFTRPPRTPLVEAGRLVGSLVSPRTAREFDLVANGANGSESPEALAMAGGNLPSADALAALDTGLYVGNLWYLNYSDRPACRMTGMTRFATFWVEKGRIVAPVNVLRFDDTIYRMLGTNLEALTRETEMRLESGTWRERQLASATLPGALLRAMTFTL